MPLYDFVCDTSRCERHGVRFSDVMEYEQARARVCASCAAPLRRPPVLPAKSLLATDSRFVDRAAAMGRPNATPEQLRGLVEAQGMELHDERDVAYTREVAAGKDFMSEQRALRASGASPEEIERHRITFNNPELRDVLNGPESAPLPEEASRAYDRIVAEAPSKARSAPTGESHAPDFDIPSLGQ